MQPDLRNPRVGDRVIVFAQQICPEQATPVSGIVTGFRPDGLCFVRTDCDAVATPLRSDQFNLDPNSLR